MRRKAWVVGILAGCVTGYALAFGAAPAQRATKEQHVVLSAVDKDGKTIAGLGPADFAVREDGVAREVLRVEQESAPMQILVAVDTSANMQRALQDLRKALKTFSQAIWAKSRDSDIALMEFGERPAQLSPATTAATVLDQGIDRIFEHSNSGAYLMDAMLDATAFLAKRNATRPVIVVFARESSPEFSHDRSREIETALKKTRASFWVVLLGNDMRSLESTDEKRYRDLVIGDLTVKSGGSRELVLDPIGIEPRFGLLADRLTSQYVVTYSRPDTLIPPTKLDVSIKRPNARVQASQWAAQQ
jgi:hypothetical protein